MNERTLSSNNRMVWQYSACLRRLVQSVRCQEKGNLQKQDIALAIFLAITVVESFVNIWFRILVERPENSNHKATVLNDLVHRRPLEHKFRTWPQLLFGKSWDPESGVGKRFAELKGKRNELMHFTSSYESVTEIPGVAIHGIADTGVFDSLRSVDADLAVCVAEETICALLQFAGLSAEQAARRLHFWTGTVPLSFLRPRPGGGLAPD